MAPEILKSLGTLSCSSVAVVDTFCEEVQVFRTPLRKVFSSVVLLLYYTGQLIRLYLCKSFRNLMRQAVRRVEECWHSKPYRPLTGHLCAMCIVPIQNVTFIFYHTLSSAPSRVEAKSMCEALFKITLSHMRGLVTAGARCRCGSPQLLLGAA